jgi:hypothetical protein
MPSASSASDPSAGTSASTQGGRSLSDQHKDAVKAWIKKLRLALQDDFQAQVTRHGFRRDGNHTPEEKLSLPVADLAIRQRLAALIEHDTKSEGDPKRGFDAVVRELTYTLVNRLVGIKVMESRGLLYLPTPGQPDSEAEPTEVLTPQPGQERSRFLRDFLAAGGSRYKYEDDAEEALLRDGLTSAFNALYADLGPLFRPDHDYACIWPSHAALANAIRLINTGLTFDAYKAPDFLGWVYQFFNVDEKDRVRGENKGTPRSPYELSVINQFYTPSWVVKVLVDNTLGRLWLQMHPESVLKAKGPVPLPQDRPADYPVLADYLIPRTGEKIRFRLVDENGEIHTFKRVRDIKLLDPACGTMHFGQYAFGLFLRMYEEEIENAGKPGWPAEPSIARKADIPAAILENNLHGIDIDPRAIQIASLSLLFTAKEAAKRHGRRPDSVKVKPRNLVVAHAVQVDESQLRALVERAGSSLGEPKLREKLFAALWGNLRYVGELGGLVQVQEGVTRVLDEWVDAQAKEKGLTKLLKTEEKVKAQLQLPGVAAEAVSARAGQMELQRSLLEEEAHRIRQELLTGLERVASATSNDPRQRLFAEDTARGLRLLELLGQYYDAILMNPPYGSFTKLENAAEEKKFKAELKAMYPCGYQDIYAAFIERATQIIEPEGYIGALVSSTFKTQGSHAKFRQKILLKRNPMVAMLDLGFGILDGATVEAAALVMRGGAL